MASLPKISLCLETADLAAIDAVRQRLAQQGVLLNRSEVIRSAIHLLGPTSDVELTELSKKIPKFKPGRR